MGDRLLGTILNGGYRIDARVATGGFGAVYRATELGTGCDVAIKVLHDGLASDPILVERFRREGETLAMLRAPHTVATYELGETPDGTPFIAMEWLRGETVVDRCERSGPLAWRQVVTVARAVCSSLAEAHLLGIIHRDLKPANIQLEPFEGDELGFVKVLDFGIAKIMHAETSGDELTQAGEVLGTLEYMAPEQIINSELDHRADLYSLGVVMYELLTGMRPFEWATEPRMLIAVMLTQVPRKASTLVADIPPELDEILARCLAPRPQHRFADVSELVAALDALEASDRVELDVRRSSWALAPVTTLALSDPELDETDDDVATMFCTRADTFGASAAPGLALATSEARTMAIAMPQRRRTAQGSMPMPMRAPIIVTSYAGLLHAPRFAPPAPIAEPPRRWRVVAAVAAFSLAFGIGLALLL